MSQTILVSGGNVSYPNARTHQPANLSVAQPGKHRYLAVVGTCLSLVVSLVLYIRFYITGGYTTHTAETFHAAQANLNPAIFIYVGLFIIVGFMILITDRYCKGVIKVTEKFSFIILPAILLAGVMIMLGSALAMLVNPNETLAGWGNSHNISNLQLPDKPGSFAALDKADNKIMMTYTQTTTGYTIHIDKVEK